jgi:N-acetylglucosaminyl-diphospho-decaprenol L-rhamnosyltransferase
MRLLIVIVNYRTPALVIDCLRSLADQIDGESRVVIADSLSGDDSIERISRAIEQSGWSAWASLIALQCNAGFAAGNNAVIAPALTSNDLPQYLWLLNPDTIVRPGAVGELLGFMDSHPRVGIAGSQLEDLDGTAQCSAFRFPSLAGEFEQAIRLGIVSKLLANKIVAPPVPQAECQIDWVSGASLIVRKKVFDDIGLMDEKYFMYFEEVDFCLAARRAGWTCWYVPTSRVVHLGGAATGGAKSENSRRRPTYWFDSRRWYFIKNHGLIYAVLADIAFAVGFALWRLRRAIQRKADPDPPKLLCDFVRNSVLVRGAG